MLKNHYDTVIIGAGPAGLMAAIQSFHPSTKILILEKMPRPAIKLRLSGKGRCNITNNAEFQEFIHHFGKNGRFLKYSFSVFFNKHLLQFFENRGIEFKLERGGRYFPVSDKAIEIVDTLLGHIRSVSIDLMTSIRVNAIKKLTDNRFKIEITSKTGKSEISCGCIVLATGGKSYPGTGSDGSGYQLASALGHHITAVSPSLVPLMTSGNIAKRLMGLSLRNVNVSVLSDNKKTETRFGEMIFTDSGVSGPVILSLSKIVVHRLHKNHRITLLIDLKPALDHKKLDQRLIRFITQNSRKHFPALLKELLPQKMIPVFTDLLQIREDKQLSQLSSGERKKLKLLLKDFRLEVTGHRSYDEAIVTSGGVDIKEINPTTMESKLVKNLYFAGEIIDIDADTGGFNLQAAFSTGWIAGNSIKNSVKNQMQF